MTYLGLRIFAGMVWAMAFSLLVAGMSADGMERRLSVYSWCMFLCFVAGTLTVWLVVEHVIERESHRNARITAEAVGEAVGQALSERDVVPITRRGT